MQIKIFNDLLSKKMTRKEFLLHLGILLLAITGISSFLKTLSDPHLLNKKNNSNKNLTSNTDFGKGAYGS